MRTYSNVKGTALIVVTTEAGQTPLEHVYTHVTGGAFGWGGAGNAQHDLALSILADYFQGEKSMGRREALAWAGWLHHMFCLDFVAHFVDGWSVDSDTIAAWVATKPPVIEAQS
jgi:hypothetical protein